MTAPGPAASLLVNVYNMLGPLRIVSEGLLHQSSEDFEIVFCDDGSTDGSEAFIAELATRSPVAVRHVWQENQGYRRSRILNQGIRESRGRVIVVTDGDCIPHRDFVRDHLEQSQPGRFLAGRRLDLGEEFSRALLPPMVARGFFDRPRLKLLLSDSKRRNRCIRVRSRLLRRLMKMEELDHLKGCNFSALRADFEAINGFDEDYQGYGREDTDVEIRFGNLGLAIKSLKGLALQFHIWHPTRAFSPANDERLDEVRQSGRSRCENGLARLESAALGAGQGSR
jgi:glycosyltransferase involved in cell wall biosynthesis